MFVLRVSANRQSQAKLEQSAWLTTALPIRPGPNGLCRCGSKRQMGIHWTMATQFPDTVDRSGKRQIASYYYPLTGPYALSDKDIIEYQLLLMKYSGADGVLIDWPGTHNVYDYPKNRQNSESLIAQTAKVGLDFAVVYEDQNINIGYNLGKIPDKIAAAQQDMVYLKENYMSQSNYIQVKVSPLALGLLKA